jgi:dethiobiotin synthetase
MHVFITGTDTNIGKTLISSWLCLHTGYDYFKPIQSGACEGTDSAFVASIANVKTHPESYVFDAPLSPHLAAQLENQVIDLNNIKLPDVPDLIIEGAGGLFVPINKNKLIIDLIDDLSAPVILVASSRLGTINHTLLSLQALKHRGIKTLGVIVSGPLNPDNCDAIAYYGDTKVLAQMPLLSVMNTEVLKNIPLPPVLQQLFMDKSF